ncbi:DNA cytosine methyltransferase, partial [Bacillus cereus group sp. BC329]
GYVLTDRLTNCIEFGVPQDRDRILMFGVHRKHVDPELSNEQLEADFHWEREVKFAKAEVLDKSVWPQMSEYKENSKRQMPKHLE